MRTDGVKYRIYPTLLDRWQSLLDAEEEFEGVWNTDPETGGPRLTEEEVAAALENALLDAVNRVPVETTEAQARGTCFNAVIDALLSGEPLIMGAVSEGRGGDAVRMVRREIPSDYGTPIREVVDAGTGNLRFTFDLDLCKSVAERYGRGAVSQHLCSAVLQTDAGAVGLYGYADIIAGDRVYDIKTTSAYQFGKYERKWQRFVYPWCLVEAGEVERVTAFEYTAVQMSRVTEGNPVIFGKVYPEEYTYGHAAAGDRLRGMCESFIGWLEANRERITDTKIFGGDVPD